LNSTELKIEVKDSVFNPNLPKEDPTNLVNVREEADGTYYYKVWLFLEGYDLPYVESVTYKLDESFPEPNQTVRRTPSNPNCQLAFWTWGLFTIEATVTDKKGFNYQVSHELVYDKELPAENTKYKYAEDEPRAAARPTLVA
jgi:transcription initiation factor IIF auxiliary subunit